MSDKLKRRTRLIDPRLAFYAWIYQGSLQKAVEFLAYYGFKPRDGRKYITRMTVLNSARKSKEYGDFLRVRGKDAPMIGTIEERKLAKNKLPRLIKKNLQRLVDAGDVTLESPYEELKKLELAV